MNNFSPEVFEFDFVFDAVTTTFDVVSSNEKNYLGSATDLNYKVEAEQIEEVSLEKLRKACVGSCNFKKSQREFQMPIYTSIAFEDPGAALACARRDLEVKLKSISRESGITGIDRMPITQVLSELLLVKRLTSSQVHLLMNINTVLNKAVHGAPCHKDCSVWLKNDWPALLSSLEAINTRAR